MIIYKWLLIDQNGIEKYVSGPFSQDDLKRKLELYRMRRDPTKIKIGKIFDRITLTNQAESAGFKEFFSEAVVDLREKPKSFPNIRKT